MKRISVWRSVIMATLLGLLLLASSALGRSSGEQVEPKGAKFAYRHSVVRYPAVAGIKLMPGQNQRTEGEERRLDRGVYLNATGGGASVARALVRAGGRCTIPEVTAAYIIGDMCPLHPIGKMPLLDPAKFPELRNFPFLPFPYGEAGGKVDDLKLKLSRVREAVLSGARHTASEINQRNHNQPGEPEPLKEPLILEAGERLISNPLADPEVRKLAVDYLTSLERVEVDPSATDGRGRPAISIRLTDQSRTRAFNYLQVGTGKFPGDRRRYNLLRDTELERELLVSPSTGDVLQSRVTLVGAGIAPLRKTLQDRGGSLLIRQQTYFPSRLVNRPDLIQHPGG